MNFLLLANFLHTLKENNHKTWFDANRPTYLELKADFEDLVGQLLLEVAKFDPSIGLTTPKDCIFRINRDVRFGKDKTPYKTSFSAVISKGGRKAMEPCYYLELKADKAMLAGGLHIPGEAEILKSVRLGIARNPNKAIKMFEDPEFVKNFTMQTENTLKTNPKGLEGQLPKDYMNNPEQLEKIYHYLKLKDFTFSTNIYNPKTNLSNLEYAKQLAQKFVYLTPVNKYLAEIMWQVVE